MGVALLGAVKSLLRRQFSFAALAAVTLTAATAAGQPVHKDFYWEWGELQVRMWFLRTEGKDVVVMRSDLATSRGKTEQVLFIVKYNCPKMFYLIHQRYVNGGLDWTTRDKPGNWRWVPLNEKDKFDFACSWLR